MKKNKRLAFLALSLSAAVFSCAPEKVDPTDNEEAVEVKVPEVSLELSGNAEKLHNEVTLILIPADDDVIERVEFFLNDQSLGKVEEAPFEFNWNTKEAEDGKYMLKAIAFNASGEGEATLEVQIKNALLTVHIAADFYKLRKGEVLDSWVFLSDKKGNVIGQPQQVVNGNSLHWQRPEGFDSDTIYFSRLDYNNYFPDHYSKPYKNFIVRTYPNLTLDEISLRGYFALSDPEEPIGKVAIRIENDFDGTKSYDYLSRVNRTFPVYSTSGPNISYFMDMYEESVKAISTYEFSWKPDKMSEREKYYRLDDFKIGEQYLFHTNEYSPMEEKKIHFPFNFNSMMVFTTGYFDKDDTFGYNMDYLNLSVDQNTELKLFYADQFPIQMTFIMGSYENKSFNTHINGKAPEVFNIPDMSATVSQDEGNTFHVKTQGTFDIGSASWEHSSSHQSESLFIKRSIFFSNQSGLSYTIPEIPVELVEIYPSLNQQLEYNSVYMTNNEALSSYEELMEYYFTDNFTSLDYAPYFALTIHAEPDAKGGRFLSSKANKTPEQLMLASKLRARGIFSR